MNDVQQYIEEHVFTRDTSHHKNLFNQYLNSHPGFDRPDAHLIRQRNLLRYLGQLQKPIKWMFIGIAPGYGGCRFTGIPFTSERQLVGNSRARFFENGYEVSSLTRLNGEISSTKVWTSFDRFMGKNLHEIFMWNIVPFHPHMKGNPMSNRDPSQEEIIEYQKICLHLIDLLQPERIAAFGRVPQERLSKALNQDVTYIKHPSRASYDDLRKGYQQVAQQDIT